MSLFYSYACVPGYRHSIKIQFLSKGRTHFRPQYKTICFGRWQRKSPRLFTFLRSRQGWQAMVFSFDITYLPSYSFSFNTTRNNGSEVQVYGNSKSNLIVGYNLGYHLLKNERSDQLLKPYLTAGFSAAFLTDLSR